MHYSARHRNGYHRTSTRQQRRHRWLFLLGLVLVVIVSNRFAVACRPIQHAQVKEAGLWVYCWPPKFGTAPAASLAVSSR